MRLFLLIIVLIFSFGLPIILLCKWKRKTGSKLKPFIVGALVFFIFVNFLEGLFHQLFLFGNNPVSAFLNSNAAAYALYAALMAGIFEECGRLFGFKVLLKQNDQIYNSVSYGIGHGGIEIMLTLGAAYLVYLIAYIGGPSAASPEIYNAFM